MAIDKRPLYRKFHITRDDPAGKHVNCFYFVLDVDHDKHAIPALTAYAKGCAEERPELSRDLEAIIRLARIKHGIEAQSEGEQPRPEKGGKR
jgi:hypothetical protein